MAGEMNTLIKVDHVHFEVEGKVILKDVDVDIKDIKGRGQIVALLGPSGVGKTTLFRILAGLEEPTSGRVLAHIRAEQELDEVHSHIMGVVQQSYPLFEHRTVYGNLNLVCKDEKKILEMLERFHLLEVKDQYPIKLSGGQKQRIAIIQQILCSEKYILMDEPFSGLDLVSKCEVCRLIRDIASLDEENTIIVVTHGVDDALKVADTIWMLGRDRDAQGNIIPGAYIKEKIDLIARGLNMNCCSNKDPKYFDLIKEVERKFLTL